MNTQKTVLVTGASRGIGYAIAKKFAQKGFNVAINFNVNRTAAESLERELALEKCRVMTVKADVSNQEQVLYMVDSVNSHFGNIDILVNNAGIAGQRLFTDITTEEWDRMFDINVKGMFHCCKAVLPQMIRNKWGKIVNISSIWGLTGASCEVHYSASKAAVIGLTRALAKEVGPSNIQVNCVAPGVIDTDMNSGLDSQTLDELKDQTPLGIIGTGTDIAETVFFLTSDNAGFITGQVISPNGGFLI
ncbi:SDR family oxidoreductase [Clostridium sp. BNL1100]|uniref:elongation factor P 5-aminopentanone reductase n=1 Tax=Clostridium sp. BNL1100 TaxID=755731 RepID=UPI00024A7BCD|nr:SDR family oxidoreductase [Clostridium sp. BNL1100]AEY66659.1 dehydrogenase of unknown specificity, short-chain alcohol dehydrogenase like protein [Clostridium sp. BNL1100]